MARINIEGSIYKEKGFQDLMINVGDRQKAKGILLELFELAQEYWFPAKKPIPKDIFKEWGLPEILYGPGGLAILQDGGVYVRGSDKQFAWLFQKKSAGEASGEARREKAKKPEESEGSADKRALNTRQRTFNKRQRNRTSLLLSLYSLLPPQISILKTL